jgi:3-phenylpropionate/trans-cinnamate dioxygenase ferredoxin reductase component
MTSRNIVIVGASAAGLSAAEALRREGYNGDLTLLGEEIHLPYDRPPLSKQLLAGIWEPDRIALRAEPVYDSLQVDVRLGAKAVGLNVAERRVQTAAGESLPFDELIIATGVKPRRLPAGHDLDGVHVLRGLDDVLALKAELESSPKVLVIGAGFLGAEFAATTRQLGHDVTMVCPEAVPMAQPLSDSIGQLITQLHTEHGVKIRPNTSVDRLIASGKHVTGALLADGSFTEAGLVLVAIGSVPEVGWMEGSGIVTSDGVVCDAYCCAAPGIYAAGDVASWYHEGLGGRVRLEHRMNAAEQGTAVALNVLGAGKPFTPVPFFWTEQYDARIQVHGFIGERARGRLVHGRVEERKFVMIFEDDEVVTGVLGWNSPRQVLAHRPAVAAGMSHEAARSLWPRVRAAGSSVSTSTMAGPVGITTVLRRDGPITTSRSPPTAGWSPSMKSHP